MRYHGGDIITVKVVPVVPYPITVFYGFAIVKKYMCCVGKIGVSSFSLCLPVSGITAYPQACKRIG